jgi:hypothetical protein
MKRLPSLRSWPQDLLVAGSQSSDAQFLDRTGHRARDVANLLLLGLVLAQRVVAVVVGGVGANEAVELGGGAGIDKPHLFEPVAQVASVRLDARHVAVHDHAVRQPSHVLGLVPATSVR